MRLADCRPRWIGSESGARCGITFHCPAHPMGDRYGPHLVGVYFANPIAGPIGSAHQPYDRVPHWQRTGETYDDLTLSPSVLNAIPGCGWHGCITGGDVSTL